MPVNSHPVKRCVRLQRALEERFSSDYLSVEDESHNHGGRVDSHFKVIMVSAEFFGLSRVARHRLLYRCLEGELAQGVHALALKLYTPEEWRAIDPETLVPPACISRMA